MKYSTGLRNHILAVGSLKSALDGGFIRIYSGPAPATADAELPVDASLLCTITVSGNGTTGLSLESSAASGEIQKAPAEEWKGTAAASGLATFFRFSPAGDSGDESSVINRIQGTVARAGGDMNLANPTLVENAEQKIDYFIVVQPE